MKGEKRHFLHFGLIFFQPLAKIGSGFPAVPSGFLGRERCCSAYFNKIHDRRPAPVGGAAGLCGGILRLLYGRHCRRRGHHFCTHPSDCFREPAHALRTGDKQGFCRDWDGVFHYALYQKRLCGLEAVRTVYCDCAGRLRRRHMAAAPDAGRRAEIPAAGGAAHCGGDHPAKPGMARRAGRDRPQTAESHRVGGGSGDWPERSL